MQAICIETKDLLLTPLEQTDLPLLQQWKNDRQLREDGMGWRFPVSIAMESRWLEKAMDDSPNRCVFALRHKDSGNLAGYSQLYDIDLINRNASYGILIGDREAWGKGLGKQVVRAVTDFAFNDLGLRKVHLQTPADNERAKRVYQALGFVLEGTLRDHYFRSGKYVDLLCYSLFNPLQVK